MAFPTHPATQNGQFSPDNDVSAAEILRNLPRKLGNTKLRDPPRLVRTTQNASHSSRDINAKSITKISAPCSLWWGKRAQSRQAPSLRVAPSNNNSNNNNNNNNTTTGSPEPAKRVITQTELNKIKDSLQDVQQFLEEAGSNHKAQILASVLERARGASRDNPGNPATREAHGHGTKHPKDRPNKPSYCHAPGYISWRTWANIAAGNAPTTGGLQTPRKTQQKKSPSVPQRETCPLGTPPNQRKSSTSLANSLTEPPQ